MRGRDKGGAYEDLPTEHLVCCIFVAMNFTARLKERFSNVAKLLTLQRTIKFARNRPTHRVTDELTRRLNVTDAEASGQPGRQRREKIQKSLRVDAHSCASERGGGRAGGRSERATST